MVLLFKPKNLGLGYSMYSPTFASKTQRFIVKDSKPSHFSLQIQLLCRHFTSKIPVNQHDFTVTYLINSCGLSPDGAISSAKRLKLRSPQRADSVLGLLRSHGFSQPQISRVVRSWPKILVACPEKTLSPKIEFFKSLGIPRDDILRALAYHPKILGASLQNRIVPAYHFVRTMISEENVAYVLKHGSEIFRDGHTNRVVPNIGILRGLGMPLSCISLLLTHYTYILMLKPEKLREVVKDVKQMGFNLEKSTCVAAISALCGNNSKSIWDRSCEVYRRWGWSEDDIRSSFRQCPSSMTRSEKKIMQVMEILVDKMGWPSQMIVRCPVVVSLSLEKRIIPRCLVVKVLLLKGLVDIEKLSLAPVFKPVEKKFLERFVTRYLEEVPQLASVYEGNVDVQDV